MDEWSHTGTVETQTGSKEHNKNLRNYFPGDEWYEEAVTKEREKWHPRGGRGAAPTAEPTVSTAPVAAASAAPAASAGPAASKGYAASAEPAASAGPAGSLAATLAKVQLPEEANTSDAQTKVPKKPENLPAGWQAHFSPADNAYYYHCQATGETCWEVPEVAAKIPAPPALPAGWVAHWDPIQQAHFFHHEASGQSTWDLPE